MNETTTTINLSQPLPEILMDEIIISMKLLSPRYYGYYEPPIAVKNTISRNFMKLFPEEDSTIIKSIIYNDGDHTTTINDLHQGYDLSIEYVEQYMRLSQRECLYVKSKLQKQKEYLNRVVEEKRKALEDEAIYNAGAEERERQVLIRIQNMPDDIIRVIAEYAYTPMIRSLVLELKYDFSSLLPKLNVKQIKALYYRFKQVNRTIANGINIQKSLVYGNLDFGSTMTSMRKSDGHMTKKEQYIEKMILVINKLKTLSLSSARFYNTKKMYTLISNGLLDNYKLLTYVSKRFTPVSCAIPQPKISKPRKPRKSKTQAQSIPPSEVIDLTNT